MAVISLGLHTGHLHEPFLQQVSALAPGQHSSPLSFLTCNKSPVNSQQMDPWKKDLGLAIINLEAIYHTFY
jgi:hypothetical protein